MIRRYGFGIGRGARRRTGSAATGDPSFAATIATLFASGAAGGAWDFTDPAMLRQDAAGTVPVTASAQPVGQARDLTGRGQHLLQPSTAAMPLWTTLPDSRPAALFDGVDDFLSLASLDLTMTDKVTVITGVRRMASEKLRSIVGLTINPISANGSFMLCGPNGTSRT